MPDVVGEHGDDAQAELEDAGFLADFEDTVVDPADCIVHSRDETGESG